VELVNRFLVPASFTGLVLSALWNAAAWARLPVAAMESGSAALLIGVFVVWFPTVFRLRKISAAMQWNGWSLALEGAPRWMRLGTIALFAYALVNFFAGSRGAPDPGPVDSIDFGRLASGHAMAFYGIAAALNYAYERRAELGIWRCPSGHDVGPKANFCEVCEHESAELNCKSHSGTVAVGRRRPSEVDKSRS
jgi:hypothetical protein